MLLAYLDEFGHIGPYIDHDHPKFNDHPVFGYAGFVMPAENVRKFGGFFEHIKETLLDFEIRKAQKHPRRWEKKGASLFTTRNMTNYPEAAHAFRRLMRRLTELDGKIVYYGQVKPVGSEKETAESSAARTAHHLRQSLMRLSTYANSCDENIMVVLDSVDDKPRLHAVETMSSFIYSKSSPSDLRRIVEAPMQVESHLYATIQFADWVCALVSRASHHHFVEQSEFAWASEKFGSVMSKACTEQSKIHLPHTSGPHRSVYTKRLFGPTIWVESKTDGQATTAWSSSANTVTGLGDRVPELTALRQALAAQSDSSD